MELSVINEDNQQVSKLKVSDALFDRTYNEPIVHQLVTSYLVNARSGTRAQKDRSEVAKSTRKPWKQKGTGRARAGTAASPLWRGGGQIFPNRPNENFSHKVNRKMYRAGISIILSQLIREDRLILIDALAVQSSKTRDFALLLEKLDLDKVLIITNEIDEKLYLSSRNLINVRVVETNFADPYNLLRHKKILVTMDAVKKFEELLK